MQLSFHNGSPSPTPPGVLARRVYSGMRTRANTQDSYGYGLGAAATDQQITAIFGSIGSAIPVAGPFIQGAASIAIAIESLFSGCGQTCVQATNIANQVSGLLTQNVQNYIAQPVHYASIQAAALKVFDTAWAQLLQACGNPALGAAGQRCITDRQAGGCTWKTTPGGWQQGSDGTWKYVWAGVAGSGDTCWNWFVGMRDPIANDPTVVPDPVSSTGTDLLTGAAGTGAGISASFSSLMPFLLIGLGIFLIMEAA